MSKAPPIPPEQRSFRGKKPQVQGSGIGRRDGVTGLQSEQPGEGDVNLDRQSRHGARRQNVDAIQHRHQAR